MSAEPDQELTGETYASTCPLAAEPDARADAGGRRAATGCPARRRCSRPLRRPLSRPLPNPRKFRSASSKSRTGSKSRCGPRRRCCATRPTSTSTGTAASGSPRGFATARITPGSPKAIASSSCRTRTAMARPTSTHTFVQEPGLVAPLGVSVIDNKVDRRAAARPDRLHRRRSQSALRSGGGQA